MSDFVDKPHDGEAALKGEEEDFKILYGVSPYFPLPAHIIEARYGGILPEMDALATLTRVDEFFDFHYEVGSGTIPRVYLAARSTDTGAMKVCITNLDINELLEGLSALQLNTCQGILWEMSEGYFRSQHH